MNKNQLEAVMTERWKYVLPHTFNSLNGRDGGQDGALAAYEQKSVQAELYDLTIDKNEINNLIQQYPEVAEHFAAKADSIRLVLGDKVTGVTGSQVRSLGRIEG